MATKAKTNKPTAKFGGLKRSKPTWKFGLIALITVLVLTSVGYVGYGKYKEHSLKAHAANWTPLGYNALGQSIAACKTLTNSVYGQVYIIQAVGSINLREAVGYYNPMNSNGLRLNLLVYNGTQWGSYSIKSSGTWWNGSVTSVTNLASVPRGDTIRVQIIDQNAKPTLDSGIRQASYLSDC
jgi:hypothetical protein